MERCSLPPSSLPWLVECGWLTLELRLCHQHGALIGRAKLTFDDDEVGA
ncbi:MAG TPA: hypothetical protein VOB72_04785 [Candidatus Dormibacteraeota bacterium]|nr:hypothetical protein [Candidatus Dormibacteraeota bacterium]